MVIAIRMGQEEDGRHYAIIDQFPGVMAYGSTREEAIRKVQAIALQVIAEDLEEEGQTQGLLNLSFVAA